MTANPPNVSTSTRRDSGDPGISIEVVTQGIVASDTIDLARSKLGRPASHLREQVSGVRIRVVHEPDPARERPWRVEACIDVDGTTIRSHASAAHSNEAVDLVAARLQRRVERFEDRRHRMPDRRRAAGNRSGEWAHEQATASRIEVNALAPDDREIVRRKVFLADPMSVEEAIFDREMLDHPFYLFIDEATGAAAVVTCTDGNAVGVERGAPHLDVLDARELLEMASDDHVFFSDGSTGAGSVLYRRHDGHYGLITTATTTA